LARVVLGIFVVALYRLSPAEVTTWPQLLIALTAAAAAAGTFLGIGPILGLAAGVGILLFHSRRVGALSLLGFTACLAVMYVALWGSPAPRAPPAPPTARAHPATLTHIWHS